MIGILFLELSPWGQLVRKNHIAQIGDNFFVRFAGFGCLSGMNQEARISYLCTQAATNRISEYEEGELFMYILEDPEILELIRIERILRERIKKK